MKRIQRAAREALGFELRPPCGSCDRCQAGEVEEEPRDVPFALGVELVVANELLAPAS